MPTPFLALRLSSITLWVSSGHDPTRSWSSVIVQLGCLRLESSWKVLVMPCPHLSDDYGLATGGVVVSPLLPLKGIILRRKALSRLIGRTISSLTTLRVRLRTVDTAAGVHTELEKVLSGCDG